MTNSLMLQKSMNLKTMLNVKYKRQHILFHLHEISRIDIFEDRKQD